MTKRRGSGRPHGPPDKVRSVTIRQRVTQAEKDELAQAAAREGKSLSAFILTAALDRARTG